MNLIPYEKTVTMPAGLKALLAQMPAEEQLSYFWIHRNSSLGLTPVYYFAFDFSSKYHRSCLRHLRDAETQELLVQDGAVVGIRLDGREILPFCAAYSDTERENNGAGYKESSTYAILTVLPPDPLRTPAVAPPFALQPEECGFPVREYAGEDIVLPEEFCTSVAGKSIGEQLDYFVIRKSRDHSEPVARMDHTALYYDYGLSSDRDGVILRYCPKVQEILVRDRQIVAVHYHDEVRYTKYGEPHVVDLILKAGDISGDLALLPAVYL